MILNIKSVFIYYCYLNDFVIINWKNSHRLVSSVDGLVGADGDWQELPGELEDGFVLEDDRAAADARAFHAKTILRRDVVAGGNLSTKIAQLSFMLRDIFVASYCVRQLHVNSIEMYLKFKL